MMRLKLEVTQLIWKGIYRIEENRIHDERIVAVGT